MMRWWCLIYLGVFLLGPRLLLRAQVPPEALAQLQSVISAGVETGTVLGGDQSAASGIYTFRGGRVAELGISKIGGGGEVMRLMPLGEKYRWAPILLGNIGNMNAVNEFESGYLAGNGMNFDTYGIQAGVGARVYFTDHFSVGCTLSGIYGQTKNNFVSRNAVGDEVNAALGGTLVNWEVETWTVIPSPELRYGWFWGRTLCTFQSRYAFYHTESFNSTSPLVEVDGNSHAWDNRLDLDIPLGVKLLGQELKTGGFFGTAILSGGLAEGLKSDYIHTANVRLVVDLVGKVWLMKWVGVGTSYYWGSGFNGWAAGVDLRLVF
jgi:hypothetical protein